MRNLDIEDAWSTDDLGPEPTIHETESVKDGIYVVRLISIALLHETGDEIYNEFELETEDEEKEPKTEFQLEIYSGEKESRHTEVLPMNITTEEGGLLYFDMILMLLQDYTIAETEDWFQNEYPMVFDWAKINQTNKAA